MDSNDAEITPFSFADMDENMQLVKYEALISPNARTTRDPRWRFFFLWHPDAVWDDREETFIRAIAGHVRFRVQRDRNTFVDSTGMGRLIKR